VTVALDTVRTSGTPSHLALEAAVFAATTADITDVHVDGRHVVSGGRHHDIDVTAELATSIEELFDHD
jgi:cytosine/adenosine deaminase-related metal-dependent hydrolase